MSVVVAVTGAVLGGPLAGLLTSSSADFEDASSQTSVAKRRIERATGLQIDRSIVALVNAREPIDRPAAQAEVVRVVDLMTGERTIGAVESYYGSLFGFHQPSLVSRDRRSTSVVGFFRRTLHGRVNAGLRRLESRLAHEPGVTVGGVGVAFSQLSAIVTDDLTRGELIALPLLFALSLWIFRGLVAALLPTLAGLLAITGTLLGLRTIVALTPISISALTITTALAVGLSIDYTLLIVSRYREELARGDPADALRATLVSAGRTVVFSSLTIAAALASLLVFPQRFVYSVGIGGIIVAVVSAAIALVVLPAVLVILGERIDSLVPGRLRRAGPSTGATAWFRLARAVTRRPAPIAALAAALMIALGIPALGLHPVPVTAHVLPTSASARRVADAIDSRFRADASRPLAVAVQAPAGARRALGDYAARIRTQPGVTSVSAPAYLSQDTWVVQAFSRGSASDRAVSAIRALPAPFPAAVTGEAAWFVDFRASLAAHAPIAAAVLVVMTLVILFAMTGSVVLPVKAVVMNVLTLSAALGALVYVFGHGRLQSLLGYQSVGGLELTQVLLVGALAFGLSTDYGVFVLARIKEAHDAGARNVDAIAHGLERSGPIVTAAALLFCVAVGALTTSRIVFVKTGGFGAVVAVALDATIVRALLVPSLMTLLGRWNWWAPGPLRRTHARLLTRTSPTS
ncbi:MAG TPA: MMPL family transporter [Solirubrobacteraceae bacterium]|nr:MMPL family transporter [Solirubrobacteraceae bacterium]